MRFETQVPLAPLTTLGVGGNAAWFARVTTEDDVAEALAFAEARGVPAHVLGGGSNVVIPDRGLDGLVIAMGLRGVTVEDAPEGALVRAGAGEPWDELVERSIALGLRGLECLSGIPGLVGATPIQNVGAYGQEVGDTIVAVRAFDRAERRAVTIPRDDCAFGYRDSRFKSAEKGRFVVLEVSFALARGGPSEIRYPELARALEALGAPPTLADVRRAVLALRRSKSMLLDPEDENRRSCGSFFVNPVISAEQARAVARRLDADSMPSYPQPDGRVKLSAAWLIERAGFRRGYRSGNVGISSRHALALVCHDGATADELVRFAETVRATVQARSGVTLEPEPVLW